MLLCLWRGWSGGLLLPRDWPPKQMVCPGASGYATWQARPYIAWCNPIQCFSWFARSLLAKQKDARPKHQDSPWAGNDRRYVQFLDNFHKMRKVLLNDYVQIIQMLVDCACQVVEYLVGLLGGRKIGTSDYAG